MADDKIEQLKEISKNETKHGVVDPNKSGTGNVVSNKTGDEIKMNYDISKMGEPEEIFVKNVIDFIGSKRGLDTDTLLTEIKKRFKIETPPMQKLEDSLWYQFTKNEKIGTNITGFRDTYVDGKRILIPHVSFNSDLDYLDDMMNRIIHKVKQLKINL